jgi:hypothetical protein
MQIIRYWCHVGRWWMRPYSISSSHRATVWVRRGSCSVQFVLCIVLYAASINVPALDCGWCPSRSRGWQPPTHHRQPCTIHRQLFRLFIRPQAPSGNGASRHPETTLLRHFCLPTSSPFFRTVNRTWRRMGPCPHRKRHRQGYPQ